MTVVCTIAIKSNWWHVWLKSSDTGSKYFLVGFRSLVPGVSLVVADLGSLLFLGTGPWVSESVAFRQLWTLGGLWTCSRGKGTPTKRLQSVCACGLVFLQIDLLLSLPQFWQNLSSVLEENVLSWCSSLGVQDTAQSCPCGELCQLFGSSRVFGGVVWTEPRKGGGDGVSLGASLPQHWGVRGFHSPHYSYWDPEDWPTNLGHWWLLLR